MELSTGLQEADWSRGRIFIEKRGRAKKERANRTSQVLPVDGDQRLIGLLSMTDDLSDAVLTPQTLDLPVTLQTQVEGVPPPAGTQIHKQINKQTHRWSR